jgi:nicotinate-nucleotide adenylyltransferase
MGGTFDPIHIGHLIIAEESRYRFQLDKVIFIPAGIPPHKPDQPITDKEDRYRMTVLATEDNPAFETSRVEMDRPGPSYMVDTLAEIKRTYGEETRLYLITGADTILEILTWHQPEQLVRMCELIAATRPGYDLAQVEKRLPGEFVERTIFFEMPGVNISSTELRKRVADGIPIRYLVPKAVEEYIIENKLYKADN